MPPRLLALPEQVHRADVFGAWSLPDRSTPLHARIEDQNDLLLAHYRGEIEHRHWYGFWNHGDVMHRYDADRHQWRYDFGRYDRTTGNGTPTVAQRLYEHRLSRRPVRHDLHRADRA
jgi:hypothetical protein